MINNLYVVSTFGDFQSIEPTPEIMSFMIDSFKDYNLIPSIFQEFSIDFNTQQPKQSQRLALISSDNTNINEQIIIASNRIDFKLSALNDSSLESSKMIEYNEKIFNSFKTILEKFNKSPNRLALNTTSSVIIADKLKTKNIANKFSAPIKFYNEREIQGWNTYFNTVQYIEISRKTEQVNIITNLASINIMKTDVYEKSDGFQVNIDINTTPNENSPRFDSNSLKEFINFSNIVKDDIIKNIGELL